MPHVRFTTDSNLIAFSLVISICAKENILFEHMKTLDLCGKYLIQLSIGEWQYKNKTSNNLMVVFELEHEFELDALLSKVETEIEKLKEAHAKLPKFEPFKLATTEKPT